jgi:hypothetical protein
MQQVDKDPLVTGTAFGGTFGKATFNSTGKTVTYTPTRSGSFNGTDSFSYTAFDAVTKLSGTGTVYIVSAAPTLVGGVVSGTSSNGASAVLGAYVNSTAPATIVFHVLNNNYQPLYTMTSTSAGYFSGLITGTATGLSNHTNYNFFVTAVNGGGLGMVTSGTYSFSTRTAVPTASPAPLLVMVKIPQVTR